MIFKVLLSIAALAVTTTNAFVQHQPPLGVSRTITKKSSSSSLNMVADNDAKVILVTGSSRGLGKAIAVHLGEKGQKVVVNYVSDGSADAAAATVEEIKAAGGDAVALKAAVTSDLFDMIFDLVAFDLNLHVVGSCREEFHCTLSISIQILIFLSFLYAATTVSDPDEIKKLFADSVEAFGTIDFLVNNAGITKDELVMHMKPVQWQEVIDCNLSGVFYCTQAFFKLASKKRTGRIINMSSVVGQIGNPGQANYAAAKGGVIGMSMANAKEFSSRGITVNTVCPGFIDTNDKELDLDTVTSGIPLKRLGNPEEVAGMVRFLALDPACDYITGHTFNVDGGIAIGG
eukprot:CAMPEP_0113643032 /NCGR_PEP_ID=MMETSP0017_2-20120614/22613_1 /TAXON_ID=2856 /ORGANISM="Cylindrotheca closterium" /LENGTH=344 /DNA_ID=CAMNT_0000554499 /DNA_START=237 /DNA_END=1275 /DNA_ORIENTATION=+ /assembly_acc=CAM_ASM_000147